MEESRIREIEEKLRKMLISEEHDNNKNEQIQNTLCGARVIRRRKGLPDVAIVGGN